MRLRFECGPDCMVPAAGTPTYNNLYACSCTLSCRQRPLVHFSLLYMHVHRAGTLSSSSRTSATRTAAATAVDIDVHPPLVLQVQTVTVQRGLSADVSTVDFGCVSIGQHADAVVTLTDTRRVLGQDNVHAHADIDTDGDAFNNMLSAQAATADTVIQSKHALQHTLQHSASAATASTAAAAQLISHGLNTVGPFSIVKALRPIAAGGAQRVLVRFTPEHEGAAAEVSPV